MLNIVGSLVSPDYKAKFEPTNYFHILIRTIYYVFPFWEQEKSSFTVESTFFVKNLYGTCILVLIPFICSYLLVGSHYKHEPETYLLPWASKMLDAFWKMSDRIAQIKVKFESKLFNGKCDGAAKKRFRTGGSDIFTPPTQQRFINQQQCCRKEKKIR